MSTKKMAGTRSLASALELAEVSAAASPGTLAAISDTKPNFFISASPKLSRQTKRQSKQNCTVDKRRRLFRIESPNRAPSCALG